MILSFTAIDKNAQLRDFSCQFTELENALDVLSSIASQGDTLLAAYVTDEESRLELPVEVFDGQQFSASFKQLEEQWQAILNEPIQSKKANDTWYVNLMQQRIKLYEQKIDSLSQLITELQQFRQQAEERIYNERLQTRLINRYNSMLTLYHHYRTQAQSNQKQILEKLSQLEHFRAGV